MHTSSGKVSVLKAMVPLIRRVVFILAARQAVAECTANDKTTCTSPARRSIYIIGYYGDWFNTRSYIYSDKDTLKEVSGFHKKGVVRASEDNKSRTQLRNEICEIVYRIVATCPPYSLNYKL